MHDVFDESFLRQISSPTTNNSSASHFVKLRSCSQMMKLAGYSTRAEACQDRFLNLLEPPSESTEQLGKFIANKITYSEYEKSIAVA